MRKNVLICLGVLAFGLTACFDSESPEDPVSVTAPPPPPAAARETLALRVVEICPGNTSLVDQFGEDPGWLELENRSTDTVDLSRFRLSGRAKDGSGWQLPSLRLAPKAREIIFASGRDLYQKSSPTDSISPTVTSSGRWADGDATPDAGLSRVRPWEFGTGKYYGYLPPDSALAYSWTLRLGDNQTVGLSWSSAEATLGFAPLDLNRRDRFWFRATIPSGQPILIGLCQSDVECWKSPQVQVIGTGKRLDLYELALAEFPGDRSKSSGFRFTPPKNLIGDFRLTFSNFGFFRSGSRPHANFKLQREGAILVLSDTSRHLRDTVEYPALEGGASWSLDPVANRWTVSSNATPGSPNPTSLRPSPLVAPRFSSQPGFHAAPLDVGVEPQSGLQIRCALGGTSPTMSSRLMDTPLRLDSSATLSCAAFSPDSARGPVATATFLLEPPKGLAVIAISVDSASLYDADSGLTSKGPSASTIHPYFGANFWQDKEIPAHVEMFENGARSFAIRSGISIYGNFSRAAPKKSFSVQFREKYGPTHLKHPLFPHHPQYTKFKGFGLRNNGGNYGLDYVRDALMSRLTEPREQDYQLSRHVVVYVNGRYQGIYDLREKLDADWADTRHGIDPANLDLIKNNMEVQAGSIVDWNDLRTTLKTLAPDDEAGWAKIAQRLDLDNAMDYFAAELYWQNTDWPSNNVRCWRATTPASKWRYMMFDMDFGMGSHGGNASEDPFTRMLDSTPDWDGYPNGQGSTVIFRRILGRKPLHDRFFNRMLVQMATNLSKQNAEAAYDSIQKVLGPEIELDAKRWDLDRTKLSGAEATIRQFIAKRGASILETMQDVFGLEAPVEVSLSADGGEIRVEDMSVGSSYVSPHFKGIPILVEAVGAPGKTFVDWSDGSSSARRTVTPGTESVKLVARFR